MFSQAEIEFLKGSMQVNNNYERSLTHRILAKLKGFEEALPLLENNPKTRAWLHGIAAKNSSASESSSVAPIQNGSNSDSFSEKGWCSGRDLDPGRELERPAKDDLLKRFSDFCVVDRRLTESTARVHKYNVDRFLKCVNVPPNKVEAEDVREYLKQYPDASPSTYANQIKGLRIFFRDFLGRGEVVRSFRLPGRPFSPKSIPAKAQLKRAYDSLDTPRERAIFLLYATSGLRKSELLKLDKESVDLEKRMIIPKHSSRTKNTWVSLFNREAEADLEEYLASRNDKSTRMVAIATTSFNGIWKKATQAAGIKITPQVLREWFCCELANLGVQDRYVDALCGRMPKSVLARHYTDYSPERLKEIYDKAGLKVLS